MNLFWEKFRGRPSLFHFLSPPSIRTWKAGAFTRKTAFPPVTDGDRLIDAFVGYQKDLIGL